MRTVHLGQYTDEHADAIVAALDQAGIHHWEKRTGRWSRLFFAGDWGTRIFVDADRLAEAEELADRVLDGP